MLFTLLLHLSLSTSQEVHNELTPGGEPYQLTLSENLRVGPDSGDPALFHWQGNKVRLSVDRKGQIFITDPNNQRIIVLDAQGQYLRTLGSRGEGHAQFQYLVTYHPLDNGSGLGYEFGDGNSIFTWLDAEGSQLKRTNALVQDKTVKSFLPSPNGDTALAELVEVKKSHVNLEFTLIKDGQIIHELSTGRDSLFDRLQVSRPSYWPRFLSQVLKREWNMTTLATFTPDGSPYTAATHTYRITQWDPQLNKPVLIINKKHLEIPFSKDEIDARIDTLHKHYSKVVPGPARENMTRETFVEAWNLSTPPKAKPPLIALLAMDGNGLLAVTPATDNTHSHADIFTPDGIFRGQYIHFNANLHNTIFRNGMAYALEKDSEGRNVLIRYKYNLGPK